MSTAPPFGLTFGNIPLINLRNEFRATHAFVKSHDAEDCLKPPVRPIQTSLLIWGGMPDDFMTLILQRSILGVEAYLPGALFYASAALGVASKELMVKIRNPSMFGAKLMVANVYHRMPASVHEELSLKHLDQELYERSISFYREIRNPIFHGKQLSSPGIEGLRAAFSHIAQLYEWIDYWHDPKKVLKSSIKLGPLTLHMPIKFLDDAP
ncbi:hypothetical protein AAE485_00565 [Acidithiobacillus ferriphilus]|uniref:hypothetical protein n=1 Tax=Acidithiobacillus ferriphilus TaxID=1689834 RepID=UPI00390C4531